MFLEKFPYRVKFYTKEKGISTLVFCTCQQKLDTKLKKLGIKIEYLYKIQ